MSKRFTDTNKWDKLWFRTLKPEYKLLFTYLCDRCNHAGFWEVDFETASHYIGAKIDQSRAMELLKEHITTNEAGTKWFLVDFVKFQYGELNQNNRAHSSVIRILEKEGAYKGLTSPMLGHKDKDKDMVKDLKDVKDVKIKVLDNVSLKQHEVDVLKEKWGSGGYQWMIEKLSAYKLSKGKEYKSDYGAILQWVVDEYLKKNPQLASKTPIDEEQKKRLAEQNKKFMEEQYGNK